MFNDTGKDYKGCTGEIITDHGIFPLFDWEEYRRSGDRQGATHYKSFTIRSHEAKRLYVVKAVVDSKPIRVIIDIGKEKIEKEFLVKLDPAPAISQEAKPSDTKHD